MSSISADRSPSGLPEQTSTTKKAPRQLPEQHDSYSSLSSSNLVASDDSPSNYLSSSSSDSDELAPHPADAADEDAASNIVGVSIGRAQSRIKARATPAEEKNRALESNGGYFTQGPDIVSDDGLFLSGLTAEPDSVEPALAKAAAAAEHSRAPTTYPAAKIVPGNRQSPPPDAKDSAALNQRSSFTRSLLTLPRRPRAWSGELKRFLPDLGSLTKRPSLSFRAANQIQSRSRTLGNPGKLSPGLQPRTWSLDRRLPQNSSFVDGEDQYEGDDSRPISELRPLDGTSAAKHSFYRRPSAAISGRPPSLRRSSSDQSLYLRASSTASSLEQRPLYENIHSQVNSRFKAIKDSLQDSSSRLLNMPTLHLQDMRTDWSTRPLMPDLGGPKSTATSDDNNRARGMETPPPPKNIASSANPVLEEAMAELTGDVVILGGYRGSVLRSAKPPHRQLWVPMKVGLNLRRVDLEVGLTAEAEERMEETIIPSGVLSHVGPVDVCRRLMKRLRKSDNALRGDLRVWDYGYDWRLSPELLSRRLIAFLENLPSNQPPPEGVPPSQHRRGATVIAHSLGGLITRHAVNQRPDLFAGVVYAGVPQHCVNILGPMRNGDDVLLSSRVLTAQVNFTFRTSYALLPEDGHCFIDQNTKEEYRIDFFDARTWDEYRLSPCIAPALPPTTTGKGFALIGKRFSLGSRDEPEGLPDLRHSHAVTATDADISARNPPRTATSERPVSASFTPNGVAASTSEKAQSMLAQPVEGLVGPTTSPRGSAAASKSATTSTIPYDVAMEYLQRTLTETKRFKSNLAFRPEHQSENRYPPAAVLYGKSVPTVYGARVASRDGIKHQDSYDDLAFAAGDGVCLASAAMLPPGYLLIRDGLVKTDRGHVGLLGDLDGVGQCLKAIMRGRKEGVGLGK
ncbi:hypothetical protein N7510_006101 [Penicillium lagena]|uniref:uncharacterized protein n=1 Tax=Penicillium lagena TaxID=94218 RepID=UPI002540162F|nr:uncharacterized protein N7510_006101 [Penicillium lagena]KAJ5612907.1 hypothetical protein N7510_006101 [Penicillium lagena]